MSENLPNISLDDIENEYARSNEGANDKKPSTFSEKNYLNVRLAKGENVKQITIRILPTSETVANPFTHVHFHSVQLKDAEKGETQWKTYVCLNPRNNPDIDHEQFGNKCPFCEENYKAYQESIKEGVSPAQKEILQKYSISNKPKEAVILRCIERGKENEGVKFWKFNIRQDKTDPYNKLINLVRQRNLESIKALGVKKNILDCYSGRDIHLTITRGNTENQTSIDIMEDGFDTPASKDKQQIVDWINDPKKWSDVFTCKPYDYLRLVIDGKTPWFDREQKKWVDRAEYNSAHGYKTETVTTAAEEVPQQPTEVITDSDDLPF